MTIALVKVSCINDRLIPLGLACLQAYLKQHSEQVKVFNFRTTEYTLPKVIFDPLIQLDLTNFIMNHQDFPLLLPITNELMLGKIPDFTKGIFPDILKDYSSRMFEELKASRTRFEAMIEYCRSTILKDLYAFDIVTFSLNYLNISESVISSCFLKQVKPNCKIIWGGPSITQSFESFKMFLSKGVCDGLVIGEGEQPLLEIAQKKKLSNQIWIVTNENYRYIQKPNIWLDSILPVNLGIGSYFYSYNNI